MYRTVVKLDPLTDPDRTGTEHQNPLFTGGVILDKQGRFIFFIPGGIKIRRLSCKFTGTGINHFKGRIAFSRFGNFLTGQFFNGFV